MFSDAEVWEIWKILSGLLHLGNIEFATRQVNHIDQSEIPDMRDVIRATNSLGMDHKKLVEALTKKTIIARGDTVVSAMNMEQSKDIRDALIKGIYGQMFVWLVEKINQAIDKAKKGAKRYSIGVLDIFGFENFESNSFEQMCINYANEALQQFFVRHIFKLEQEEYNIEGISWQHIEFVDNQEALDLIAAKPLNIISLIDEEAKFPKGTDQTLLQKLHSIHGNNRNYLKPKSDANVCFGLQHFAGIVEYDSRGFLEKNRDTFSRDLVQLIQTSKNKFVGKIFAGKLDAGVTSPSDTRKKGTTTLGAQFKKSLDSLMQTLATCQPRT